MKSDLREWFESEGLLRYSVEGDPDGEVVELVRGPVVALGARDEDFVIAPDPARVGYPGPPLDAMQMEDFNDFMFRWLEAAVAAGDASCARCGKLLLAGDDLPDAETWDAILIEKEIVAWMLVHFDCKKLLAKKLKGLHPFDLAPRDPPIYDLSHVSVPIRERGDGLDGEPATPE